MDNVEHELDNDDYVSELIDAIGDDEPVRCVQNVKHSYVIFHVYYNDTDYFIVFIDEELSYIAYSMTEAVAFAEEEINESNFLYMRMSTGELVKTDTPSSDTLN